MPIPTLVRDHGASSQPGSFNTLVYTLATPPVPGNAVVIFIGHQVFSTQVVTGISGLTGATWTRLDGTVGAGTLDFGVADIVGEIWMGTGYTAGSTITITYGAPTRSVAVTIEVANVLTTLEHTSQQATLSPNSSTPAVTAQATASPLYGITATFGCYWGEIYPLTEPSGVTDLTDAFVSSGTYGIHLRPFFDARATNAAESYTWTFRSVDGVQRRVGVMQVTTRSKPNVAVNLAATSNADAQGSATLSVTAAGQPVITTSSMLFEARVYSGADPTQMLAIVTRPRELRIHDPFNDTGYGTFGLAAADPVATSANLAVGNLVRVYIGGLEVFSFWIEEPTYTIASPNGTSGETVVIAGRAREAYTEEALVWLDGVAFNAASAGFILRSLVDAAKARGGLTFLNRSFSDQADSAGVPWVAPFASMAITMAEGADLLSVIGQLRAQGLIVTLRQDFVLEMWQAYGTDHTSDVVLRQGAHLRDDVRWTQPFSRVGSTVVIRGNPNNASVLNIANVAGLQRRREIYVRRPDTTDQATLNNAGVTENAARENARTAINIPVAHGVGPGEYEPYRHYQPGDTVAMDIPGRFTKASERIAAINVVGLAEGGYSVTLDLAATQPDPLINIARQLAELRRR